MATTYNVWFGESGNMTLRSEGQASTDWTIPAGELSYGTLYQWRIDSIDEYGTTYGDVWEFTTLSFAPPTTNIATLKYLVVASNNKVWYES